MLLDRGNVLVECGSGGRAGLVSPYRKRGGQGSGQCKEQGCL